MFWAGLLVGLMLGAPMGFLTCTLMLSAKRGRDELDRTLSEMKPRTAR